MDFNYKKCVKYCLFQFFPEAMLALLLFGKVYVFADMPTSQFLLVGQGARSEAMGEATVADCFDQTSTFWNPAGMSFARNQEIGLNSVPLIDNITVNYISYIHPGKKFSFGLRAITMYSAMSAYDANANLLPANLSENDSNIDVFAAYKLLDYLSIGVGIGQTSMKYAVPEADYSASTYNGNIGFVYYRNALSIAASIANLGGTVKLTGDSAGEPQPEVIRIGAAYRILDAKNLTFAAGIDDSVFDKTASGVRVGTEYAFTENFALRGGFIFENNGDTKPTVGFGAYYAGIGFDFSSTLSPASLSDITILRFGISYKFGTIEPEPT